MDNDLLKKALQSSLEASRRKENLLPDVYLPPDEFEAQLFEKELINHEPCQIALT